MLVSLNWLKEYVNITVAPEALADALTMSGTKVETVEPVCDVVSGIITGKIIKKEKHPNADKLTVLTIDIGKNEALTIITNATNVNEDNIVPVAVEGAVIANGQQMKATDFRGVLSQGMLCSVEELGMNTELFSPEVRDGIYILPEGTPIGADAKTLLWVDDLIIDVELTANRGDCQSIYGIARETAATLDEEIAAVDCAAEDASENTIADHLSVAVETPCCPRYVAKMFKVRAIETSPLWMQVKLLNSGVRPINNIVDVTNYVMLELGQPLHAFDYKSLGTSAIVVKTNNSEKTVITLDEKERAIDPEMMMITNGEKPVAVAGVMGGLNSEITDATEYVVLESACFDKMSIRHTSKKLGLRTEASGRYEKGIYPNLAMIAAQRAEKLLVSIGACEAISGTIDIYKNPTVEHEIEVNAHWINRFIGIDLSVHEITEIFKRLFLTVVSVDDATIRVRIPDYRQDLEVAEDLAEEIARIYGYDKIPNTIMGGTTLVGGKTEAQQYEDLIADILIGAGYYETLTTSFTSLNRLEQTKSVPEEGAVILMNPLGEETSVMRPNLMTHQLEVLALNSSRKIDRARFFEIANTYHINPQDGDLPLEKKHLVVSGYGHMDYFELKGAVEGILEASKLFGAEFTAGGPKAFHPGRCAAVIYQEQTLGYLGEIHPLIRKKLGLPKDSALCELDFSALTILANRDIRYQDLPRYPGSSRDIAVVLDTDTPAAEIVKIIKSCDTGIIEHIELFDIYTGTQIPEGKKSLAYAIDFRHAERTLTDADIDPVMDNIVTLLADKLNAHLRD